MIARRLVAAALAAGLVTGCTLPRAPAVALGVASLAGSAVLFYGAASAAPHHDPPKEPQGPLAFGPIDVRPALAAGGILLAVLGLAFVGPVLNDEHATPLAVSGPPGSARAELASRTRALEVQLDVDARSGRCEAAAAAARRLAAIDPVRLRALAEEPAIARCL